MCFLSYDLIIPIEHDCFFGNSGHATAVMCIMDLMNKTKISTGHTASYKNHVLPITYYDDP